MFLASSLSCVGTHGYAHKKVDYDDFFSEEG